MGSEIEFEHGGNEVAVEIEAEETGEFEHEIERGGEVALEQFWIQKSFGKGFNIRLGHIIVPVGQTNNAHLPTQFFTCYRPEGEFNIMPCTWHETGISLWGRLGGWRYEAIVVPALNSNMFNNANWVKNGSASGYEFRVANHLAGALRIDNYSIRNFHWGVSGYVGNTFNNDIVTNEFSETSQYKDVKGTVAIGTVEFDYKSNGLVVRGNFAYSDFVCRLESTIGIYGTGLIDAIPDDSLKAQYQKEYNDNYMQNGLNPAMWAGGDWAPTGLYGNTNHPKRYTYALTRGPLQDAPGANAIWNITNVTHRTKMGHYMTAAYATKASQDPDVQAEFYNYFPQYNLTGNVETDIYNYLMMNDIPDEMKTPEMSDEDYVNFMVWHRGLAVPAARNLEDPEVQRGKELFKEIGCAYCHRPSWQTGDDNFTDPTGFFEEADARLPRYPNQKIWPYSDYIQHKLHMENDIRMGWCRTIPLWGRGLSAVCTGRSDRLHDCRAQTVIEAIMWHGNPQSDARRTVEKFRELPKKDRDAVVKFIDAI